MNLLLLLPVLLASETDLLLPRTTEGVAAGIGELRGQLQDCVSAAQGNATALVHLRFTVGTDGAVGAVESILPGSDPALTDCMAAPFQALRFDPGEQEMPVEVPISVQRRLTEQTRTREAVANSRE